MKKLLEYILESEIDDLKELIKKKIDELPSNSKLIKKINKLFDVSEDNYNIVKDNINNYLSDYCGFNKYICSTVIQKIKHYGLLGLFDRIINIIKDNSKNKDCLSSQKLIEKDSNNIYQLIKDFVKPILNDNNELNGEFTEFIEDLAAFNIPGKSSIGKMELLSRIFLKDLNPKNNSIKDKPSCDINTVNYTFEYKTSGGRIMGNTEQSKPKSPEEINKTFIKLIFNYFLSKSKETDTHVNKDLEQAEIESDLYDYLNKLSKTENIFRNTKGNEIEKILNPIFKFNITENKLNEIILYSFLSQIPTIEEKISNDEIKYLLNKYPIAIDKKISETGKNNLKRIFLILGLCNYWNTEKWNYLILFEKPDKKECTGYYKLIKEPDINNLIKSMDKNIGDKCYSGAFPCYGEGTNIQNHAPMIKYKK